MAKLFNPMISAFWIGFADGPGMIDEHQLPFMSLRRILGDAKKAAVFDEQIESVFDPILDYAAALEEKRELVRACAQREARDHAANRAAGAHLELGEQFAAADEQRRGLHAGEAYADARRQRP